jgi:hypothetical protein
LKKEDQAVLVSNIGRLVARLDLKDPMSIARRILLESEWPKRKRYIRLPGDITKTSARSAASGGTFAGIIDRLVAESVRKGLSPAQARIETVNDVLKGTSFRRPSRFQMPEDAGDAALLLKKMESILDTLAQDADLPRYFELVSKYPIYPYESILSKSDKAIQSGQMLELDAEREPNRLFSWDNFADDDELNNWIPWWAPKCVIGHLYVPFQCSRLRLTEKGAASIKEACAGEITRDNWERGECSLLVEPFADAERTPLVRYYHRLPIWLVTLPSRTGIVACLYASVHFRDYFQIEKSIKSETYYSYENTITPCFVGSIGETINDDAEFFCGDYDFQQYYYVRSTETRIDVIGSSVDKDVKNFMAEVLGDPWSIDEVPDWLHSHPVQRFLKLTPDSDAAEVFALSPRIFPKDLPLRRIIQGIEDTESIFRPAFTNAATAYIPPLRQNTIAAYLLQNFLEVGDSTIFEALKGDALARAAAVQEVIGVETSKYQEAFDARYGK